MKRACVVAFVVFLFPPYLAGQKGQVLTQHNDPERTGANLSETQLNVSNVNSDHFGLVFSLPVDGPVYAQPLYVPALKFPDGSVHNVVYIATMHNNVYAFDADDPSGKLLWHRDGPQNLGPYAPQNFMPMAEAAAGFDLGKIIRKLINGTLCAPDPAMPNQPHVNIQGGYGITGTPVIDPASNTLFAVAKTMDSGGGIISDTVHYFLHALDLTTGRERDSSPVEIKGQVASTSKAAKNGTVPFQPWMQLQRPGLLLSHGAVYIAFGAHHDTAPYRGWIFAYDAKSLQPKTAFPFSTTPNADEGEGGIWQSGNGLAADASGNIYFMTGNGPFDADHGGTDLGDSFVKLDKDLNIVDWFTPDDFNDMDLSDVDLGSAGPMLFPDVLFRDSGVSPTLVGGGKKGVFYLLDQNNLGHLEDENHPPLQRFQATQGVDNTLVDMVGGALAAAATFDFFLAGAGFVNPIASAALAVLGDALMVAAEVAFATNVCGFDYHHIHGSPVVWNSPAEGPLVYVWGERDYLRVYKFDPRARQFPLQARKVTVDSQVKEIIGVFPVHASSMKDPDSSDPTQKLMPGGILSVSANGSAPGTGIVWASVPESGDALAALRPGVLRAFDAANIGHELWCASTGTFAKFNPPTVVNGKVYLATFDNRVNVYGLAERKSFQSGFKTKSSPFVSGGYVYFQGTDDKLWKVNIDNPSDKNWLGGYNTKSTPFVSNGYIYFQGKGSGDKDDRLYKVNVDDPNHDNVWLGGYKTKSSPFVSNGYVYFQGSGSGDKDDRLYKVDVNNPNGPNNWLGGYKTKSSPFVSNDYIYFQGKGSGDKDDRLYKVNVDDPNHDNVWLGGYKIKSTPFVYGKFALFVADPNGGVFTAVGAPDQESGLWRSVSEGHAGPRVRVTAVPYAQRFAAFVADPKGGIFATAGTPDQGWGLWRSVSEGNAGPGVSVTAVPYGKQIAVFTADRNGGIFATVGTPDQGWGLWRSVSEGNAGPGVSVTAVPYGKQIAVLAADRNGGIFATVGTPDKGWGLWRSVSEGNAGPDVSVTAVPYGGHIAVFTSDRNGGVFATVGTPDKGWAPWQPVSQGHAGPKVTVTAVSYGQRLAVFVADSKGGVFATAGAPDQGWEPWKSVSEGHAGPGVSVTAVPSSYGYVYFQGKGSGDKDDRLYKVDVNNPNGPNNWLGGLKTKSTPFVENGTYVYFQGTDKQLWRVSTDGTGLASPGCGNWTEAPPFVYGNKIFFRGKDDDRLLMVGAYE